MGPGFRGAFIQAVTPVCALGIGCLELEPPRPPAEAPVIHAAIPLAGGQGHIWTSGLDGRVRRASLEREAHGLWMELSVSHRGEMGFRPVLLQALAPLAGDRHAREDHFNRLPLSWDSEPEVRRTRSRFRIEPPFDPEEIESRPEWAFATWVSGAPEWDASNAALTLGSGSASADRWAARFQASLNGSSEPDDRRRRFARIVAAAEPLPPAPPLALDRAGAFVVSDHALPTPVGTEGRARCVRIDDEEVRPGLLYLNGHFRRSLDFDRMLAESAAAGFVTCGVELHNLGTRSGDGGSHHFGAYWTALGASALRPFAEEAQAGLAVLRSLPHVDRGRVGAAGASMGGFLAVLLGALLPDSVAAVASAGGTTDFAELVRTSGSDAEQHPVGFAAASGLEGLTPLMAPRPLLLLFGRDDDQHGHGQSEQVRQQTRRAYVEQLSQAGLHVRQVAGGHDQARPKRAAILDFMVQVLRPPQVSAPAPDPLPDRPDPSGDYVTLLDLVRADLRSRTATAVRPFTVDPFPGSTQLGVEGGLDDVLYGLPGSDPGEPPVSTALWRLRHPDPRARVLVVDDGGRGAAGFGMSLRRCGLEVFVVEPRTFDGSVDDPPPGWRRMWRALASASLGQPLGVDVARDLATAYGAASRLTAGPIEYVWASGVESGTASLIAAEAGALGRAHLILSDGPGDLDSMAEDGLYPPWTAVIPGWLRWSDLDDLARRLGERLTVTSAQRGLRPGTAPPVDPFQARFEGARALLERIEAGDCLDR